MEERKILLIGGPENGKEYIMKGPGTVFMVAQFPPIKLVLTRDINSPAKIPDVNYFTYKQSLEDRYAFIYSE